MLVTQVPKRGLYRRERH